MTAQSQDVQNTSHNVSDGYTTNSPTENPYSSKMTVANAAPSPPSSVSETTAAREGVPISQGLAKDGSLQCRQSSSGVLGQLPELFDANIAAKIWRVAASVLQEKNPPDHFPEYVLTTGPSARKYTLREADFWTCGFFPGSLYGILERSIKFPHKFPSSSMSSELDKDALRKELLYLCKSWSEPIRAMASRTDTHDMGFIIQPSLRADWELTGNTESLQQVLTAAQSLASRYDERAKAIRSWDKLTTKKHTITNLEEDFLVIIDGMCNLDLLYYAGHHLSSPHLISIATTHAHTIAKTLLRPEPTRSQTLPPHHPPIQAYSTYHVANLSPNTGTIKQKMTAQGYADASTWARGQAWAIMGFAQTYLWTHDRTFLDIAGGLAEYFIARLETAPECVDVLGTAPSQHCTGRYVPLWDFDAPILDTSFPLRDSSAGVIAANGLVLLYQSLSSLGLRGLAVRYLDMAVRIVRDTLELCLAPDRWVLATRDGAGEGGDGKKDVVVDVVRVPSEGGGDGDSFDAILMHATANFNEFDFRRYWDHGLVYGDYFLVEFGNKLLRLGLV
ncbi:hypothetical protein FQN55_005791 [Onygenales sp. PD_40]|nr:hypothetical protein FQN55_005791 [Onygenales sp. PD_40]